MKLANCGEVEAAMSDGEKEKEGEGMPRWGSCGSRYGGRGWPYLGDI